MTRPEDYGDAPHTFFRPEPESHREGRRLMWAMAEDEAHRERLRPARAVIIGLAFGVLGWGAVLALFYAGRWAGVW